MNLALMQAPLEDQGAESPLSPSVTTRPGGPAKDGNHSVGFAVL